MIKELVNDIAKYLPSYVVPAIVGLIAIPIITRLFPPEDYGNYVLVLVTVSVLFTIATTWIGAAIIRFFPAYELDNRLGEFYATIVKLAFVSVAAISLIFVGVLFLAKGHISANLYSLMRIGLLVFIATSWLTLLLTFLRAKRRVSWYTSFTIWRSVAGLGFGVTLVMIFQYGVEGLLWGALLSTVVALPLLWKVSMGKPSFKEGSIRSPMSMEMTKYGFPLVAVNISTWMLCLSDRYVLGFFRGSQEVGIYSASYAISEQSILIVASLFVLASGPIGFSIWESQGVEASQEFLKKVTRYYLLIGLPAAVGLSVLAKPVISVLAAPAYFPGYVVVPLVAFSAFLIGIEHRFGLVLAFYKKTNLSMYYNLIGGGLNLGLNFLLIPKYGYIAAAATTFVACAANLVMVIAMSRHFLVWQFPFKSLGRAACASIVMGIMVYYLSIGFSSSNMINLMVSISAGAVAYFMILLLLRELQPEEIRELQTLKSNFMVKFWRMIR